MEELRVSITADASGVGPGIAEATQQVAASAETIAAAQAKATAATKALAEAQLQLGAAAEAGNAQAAAIVQQYAAASTEATAAVDALTSAENANTAATAAGTVAEKADTAAIYNRGEAYGAARIGMGALSGSIGGVESGLARLAASSALVGPLLGAMIPLALFAAAGVIVWDLGKAIAEAFDVGGEKAREFQLGVTELDGSFRSLIDSTSLEADKIEAANAKLEHRPNPNALKEAIDQALADADQMNSKLDGLISKEEKLLKMQGLQGSTAERFIFNETGSRQEQVDLEQHEIHLAKAVTLEQQLAESKRFTATEQARLLSLSDKQAALDAARNTSQTASAAMTIVGVSDFHKELDALDLIVGKTKQETTEIEEQIRLRDAQTKHEGLEGGVHSRAAKAEKDPNAQAKRLEVEEAIADARRREQTAAEIAAAVDAEGVRLLREEDRERTVASDQVRRNAEEQKQNRAEQIDAARQRAQAIIQAANLDYEATQQEIKEQEALGEISHRVAAQRLTDAVNQRERSIGGALGTEQGLFDPNLGKKEKLEYDRLQTQMTDEAKRAALQRQKIAEQEATKLERIYMRVADAFNKDFTGAFDAWATKSQTAGQAFGHMLGDMELQVVDFVAKWLLEKAEMWAMDKLLQVSGLAAQKGTQTTANISTIAGDAGVAAANTMAYFTAIDPITAPAMAAVSFAETMAFAASAAVMDSGGMMGHMTYALNTSGSPERVLSPSQTRNFETMVNGGGTRSAHLNYAPTIHGNANEKMLQEHSTQMMGKLRSMLRPEAWQ